MNIKMIGLQVLTATTLMAMTHSAFALSCRRPDPVQQCQQMQADKLSPIWVNGTLKLKKIISQEKNRMRANGKGAAVAEYHFTGSISDKDGKREVKNAKMEISTSCLASWCGNLPQDKTSGYFLLKTEANSALKLHIGACSSQPMSVTEQQAKAIESCVTPMPVKKLEPVKQPEPAKKT